MAWPPPARRRPGARRRRDAARAALVLGLLAAAPARLAAPDGPGPADAGAGFLAPRLLDEADRVLSRGVDPARDREALDLVLRALALDPTAYEGLWRAARAAYHVADRSEGTEKLRHFERGIDLARRAVARRAGGVEGHFWLGANLGGHGQARGVFHALRTIPRIRAAMEAVLRLDDRYEDGNAYRALGELDRQLPRLLGGSLDRAIARLERGVAVAPRNAALRVSLAHAYAEAGRRGAARQELEAILRSPDAPSSTRARAWRLLEAL